ncbi:MAG: PilZ domain-containing protein [Gammaproteobacteria bacterium]|nr:PilZ domain-containing protein [Gammaproteobacteria bacterium]MDJ0872978.1 PilZ domain-containing protein [Gammaproteobacteria bacterium]MDJ0893207.1 PilZ domain-containing protein [Gammaproteobacteria bacterium]
MSRLRVFKRNTHTYVGQVRDIHHAGMSMHAVQPMSATESLELEISPVAHGDAAQMIPVRARKVWQENDAGDHSIEIGFRLTRLSRSAQQAIDALRTVNTDYRQRRHPNVPST